MSPKVHGIVIHIDHILPRSKYPELSLVFDNLQVLCESCNLGKSNKDETDWRPDDLDAELEIVYEAIRRQ
jgi:5-methylcytosine-specific restriction endonuclease McrA